MENENINPRLENVCELCSAKSLAEFSKASHETFLEPLRMKDGVNRHFLQEDLQRPFGPGKLLCPVAVVRCQAALQKVGVCVGGMESTAETATDSRQRVSLPCTWLTSLDS